MKNASPNIERRVSLRLVKNHGVHFIGIILMLVLIPVIPVDITGAVLP